MEEFRKFIEAWGDIQLGYNVEGLGRLFTVRWNNMEIPLAIDSQNKIWFLATPVDDSLYRLSQEDGKNQVYWHPLTVGGEEQIAANELKKYMDDRENINVSDALDFAHRWLKNQLRQRKMRLNHPNKFDKEVDIVNKNIGKPKWIPKTQVQIDRLYNPPESQLQKRQKRKWGL